MVTKMIAYIALWAVMLLPNNIGNASNSSPIYTRTLPEVVIKTTKVKRISCNLHGYTLLPGVNKSITNTLEEALKAYKGPKPRVTSLRRYWNYTSKHAHGKAVDFEWSSEMIDYLVSSEGQEWLSTYNFEFYIEGKPGSPKVRQYKGIEPYSQYIFENPNATGDHIHLHIK